MSAKAEDAGDTGAVDAFMSALGHPYKTEMEAVRAIIMGAGPRIAERIKWKAPSFFYREDLAAFHPRAKDCAHLIILFPGDMEILDEPGLLGGNHVQGREARFYDMDYVEAKRPALEKLVDYWVRSIDE